MCIRDSVNTHHKSIEKIMDDENKRYGKIISELKEVNEQIAMINGGTYGES